MEIGELKSKIFALLREDEEFRYAVAGLLGLDEILRRLDRHETELAKLREDMNKLRADMIEGFKRHDEEITRLREDMIAGFKRHDEEIAKVWGEIVRLREDMVAGFKRHDEELIKLRADMIEGFNLLRRHIDALGARWGIISEKAFREGLRGIIEKELGLRVEKWVKWDGEGYVFGHPCTIDVDVAVHDDRIILIEVKSHVSRADAHAFKRKAEFYEKAEGRRPSRLIIVTPYADEDALETAKQFQIEVYMGV
ncbi:MAG: DUF3782 domain-containing protein [Candidatus Bathyarchaeia archaeon]